MVHDYQNLIDFLLKNAGASIRYRVKKEILGDITDEEKLHCKQRFCQSR